ncbi:MAG: chemotaxis protein CheW [Cyanobacteria bacterium J06559_3]
MRTKSIHQVAETVTISPHSISPAPNMPPTMLGLVNYQNQMLWVTDLARLLGLVTSPRLGRSCNLVLLRFKHVLLGLRVQEIGEVLTISPTQLQVAPAQVPATLVPFLQGCFQQGEEVLLVLDAKSVLQAPILRPR